MVAMPLVLHMTFHIINLTSAGGGGVFAQLDQPESLGLPSREYYLKQRNDSIILAYERFAVDVATLLGADAAEAQSQMKDMVDFEIKLANVSF